jgi:sulfoquinovosidase
VLAFALGPTTELAGGAVRIGTRSILVDTPAGEATVSRLPFRITIADARGRVVLRETHAASRTLRLPPPPAPLVPTYGPPLQETLYAPLEFTVGGETDTAQETGIWEGNLLTSVRTGRVYSARSVRSVRALRDGVRLVVSTTDPSGRVLIVTIAPGPAGTIGVSVRPVPAAGVVGLGDSFVSGRDEAFHGFGGRHSQLDQGGASFYNWIDEENMNAAPFKVPGSSTGALLYPNGPQAAYYPQASFVSSRPYGFLLDQPELARFRLDSDRPGAWQADVAARELHYVVAPGPAQRAVAALTAITGRQRVSPSWAVQPTLDREVTLGETPTAYVAQVRQDLVDVRRYHLPLGAYRLEGWAALPAATVRELIGELHRRGMRALVYFRPFVAQDASGTEAPGAYGYAVTHGLVARTRSGAPYTFGDSFGGRAALVDYTNPHAVQWWASRIRAALDLGADGFMQDFGEEVLPGMVFHDGETGLHMHNQYPVIYDRATRRILDQYAHRHRGRDFFFYTRSGYTGQPGSAAYENGNFAGDETTDWTSSSGIASVVPDMLNRAIGGAYGYSTDIGGYFDLSTPVTSKELLLRWAELAVFTPFFRLHGSIIHGTHTPWRYDAQTIHLYRQLSLLHQRAVPLILSLWRQAQHAGVAPTQPLWLAFPSDLAGARQDQEWVLGPNLLVAPVVTQGARAREVYFPPGCWRSPQTGRTFQGPETRAIAAPLTVLPYFFRCGTRPI